MGLAEPRKRIKISHDPNNLNWAHAAESYGQKLLSSQGWRPGQGLGARNNAASSHPLPAPKIRVTYKDDNLGLGASLQSKDPEHARAGLDAFQSLLGRLNCKDEAEVKKIEKKCEDRKLALWTQGKWGGVIFVPGGVLGGGDGCKERVIVDRSPERPAERSVETPEQRAARKAARTLRKAERRKRKESKLKQKARIDLTPTTSVVNSSERIDLAHEEHQAISRRKKSRGGDRLLINVNKDASAGASRKRKKQRKWETDQRVKSPDVGTQEPEAGEKGNVVVEAVQLPTPLLDGSEEGTLVQGVQSAPRRGRHVIRGRDIEAKKMAFADAKMLDEIFMKKP